MPKVWNWNNMTKYDPADVKKWNIHDPGEIDYYRGSPDSRIPLTRWQVEAIYEKLASVNVGYYDTHEEAVKAVDELDDLGMQKMVDSLGELLEKEPENDRDNCD